MDKEIENCLEDMANEINDDEIGYDSAVVARNILNSCKNCYAHYRGKYSSRNEWLDNFNQVLSKAVAEIEREKVVNKQKIKILNTFLKDYQIVYEELYKIQNTFNSFYEQFETLNKKQVPAEYVRRIVTLKRNFFDIVNLYLKTDREIHKNKQKLVSLVKTILNKK